MAQGQVRVLPIRDFSGGINFRDDAFQLAPNESNDLLNVDLLPSGGVARRKTIETWNGTFLTDVPDAIWAYDAASKVVVQTGSTISWATSGASFTNVTSAPLDVTTVGRMRAAESGRVTTGTERLYIQRNAEQVPFYFNGTTATALTDAHGAYNEDVLVPAGGKMPKARYLLSTMGFMFTAWTDEGGTDFKSRVRWSHPGEPEDWRVNDFVDVDPGDGDEIVGLAPFRDSLLIFKRESVHRLSGYSPETFQLERLTNDIGAVSQESIAVGLTGVAFFDDAKGVHLYDGSFKWLWSKIHPKLVDNVIPPAYLPGVTMGWMGPRLYCSVPYDGTAINDRTFVHDERINGTNWTVHDYGVGPMLHWNPPASSSKYFACSTILGLVIQLEVDTGKDVFIGSQVGYNSYYTTAWFDAGAPGVKKRYRRPKLVLGNDFSYPLSVTAWKDYDLNGVPNFGTVQVTGSSDVSITVVVESPTDLGAYDAADAYDADGPYDDATPAVTTIQATPWIWGTSYWGQSYWAGALLGSNVVKPGPTLGRALAVRMKFAGSKDVDWRLDAIQIPYVMGRVK